MRTVFSILILAATIAICSPAAAAEPSITSITIEGTNVVVKISAPSGVRKVTLESRSRLIGSAWAPKALHRFDTATPSETEIVFTIPRTESLEVLRIRTDEAESLPLNFFRGTNQFAAPASGIGNADVLAPGGGAVTFNNTTGGPGIPVATARDVVESDIWKVSGDTVYFFNNYRGLQVLDISNPAVPSIRGGYPIVAAGEQMYVLPSSHAVLLTRSWCSYGGVGDEAKVMVIDPTTSPIALTCEIGVPGYILESRMVGSALYIVTQTYEQRAKDGYTTWETGTGVTSIDLSNPATPVKRNTLFLPGYSHMISASDRYLFVITQSPLDGNTSDIQIIDISSPDGTITAKGTAHPQGRVQDKYKINLDGDILTVVSHLWISGGPIVKLENFSLANPQLPVRVGSLSLAQGEQLYATRFDGKRAYIVTYRRIDPLWIVDLSDPTNPVMAGELQVPGWSTYLRPLGNDRLLALGIDDTNSWRVALSLFDVSNAKAPALLSKVVMGENSSWSEANSDEKALTVLTGDGLILVPWQTYTANGYVGSVQLVDLGADKLTARGQITGQLYPRRATLQRDHVISISGRDLVSYLVSDRDHPEFKADLDLAWPVDKVFLAGDYLVEIENANSYSYGFDVPSTAILRIARADSPDRILNTITFTNGLPIAGSEFRDGKLYLAQTRGSYWPWVFFATDGSQTNVPTNPFVQSIWDTSQLPELTLVGSVTANPTNQMGMELTAHWPKPGLLVWGGGTVWGGYWGWGRGWGWGGDVVLLTPTATMMPMAMSTTASFAPSLWWGPWFGGTGGRFLGFDVSNPVAPSFKSEVDLNGTSFNFSKGVVANGMIYLSHLKQEAVEIPVTATNSTGSAIGTTSDWGGTNIVTIMFVTRYYLDVIDYADPSLPTVRKPVNIPGHLQGVTHNGGVLYTLGNHFTLDGPSDFTDWLDASAYDGVSAFLVNSLNLTNWPHPVLLNGSDIFIGQASSTNTVERWRLADTGMFEKLSATDTKTAIDSMRFIGDMAVFSSNNSILLYDATDRANLKLVGGAPIGCNFGGDIQAADGALGRGLWKPEGQYGVGKISVEGGGL